MAAPPIPLPDDFAERLCAGETQAHLMERYGVGRNIVRGWCLNPGVILAKRLHDAPASKKALIRAEEMIGDVLDLYHLVLLDEEHPIEVRIKVGARVEKLLGLERPEPPERGERSAIRIPATEREEAESRYRELAAALPGARSNVAGMAALLRMLKVAAADVRAAREREAPRREGTPEELTAGAINSALLLPDGAAEEVLLALAARFKIALPG